jgi:DNA-directed RNA polymerase specialized sigma24 family protein
MPRRRVDLREAAEILGTSVDAVRKRIQRGTLESEKEDGKVYV